MGRPGMSAGPREARVTPGALNLPLLLGGSVLLSCPTGAVSGRTTLWIVPFPGGRGGRISGMQDK